MGRYLLLNISSQVPEENSCSRQVYTYEWCVAWQEWGGRNRAAGTGWGYSLGSKGKLPVVRANPLVTTAAKDGVSHGLEGPDRVGSHI